MAFEGCRNTYASIPKFSTNKYKAIPTEDDGAYGSLGQPLIPNPSFNLPENQHTSYTPWSNNAENPFELLQCTQNSARNLSDGTDCDGVTDLYGLVSNILEDGDSLDSFSHTERNSSKFTSIWSPQTIGNDLLQYSQSDTKTEANPAFFPNHKYNEQVQGQNISKDIKKQFNGFNTSNQWLSKSSNGDMDSYKPHSLKLSKPPGLPMPSMENCFLSTMRESQHHLISNDTRGTPSPLKNIPIQKNGFGHQGKMDSSLLNAYEDHYIQSCPKLYQQNTPQEVNKLVSHFHDLMAPQERMVEQKDQIKLTNSTMSPHSASKMEVKRSLWGDIGPVQRELNGGIMQHTFQGNNHFQGQNTKHFQQSTSNSASFNPPKSYQGKIMTHGQTLLPDVNKVLNQYSQDQIQQSQQPNKASRDRGCVPSKPFNQCQPVSEFGPWQFPQMQRSPLYKQDYSSGDGNNVHYRPGQTQMGMSVDTFRRVGDSGLQVEKSKLHSTAGGFVKDGFLSTQRTEINTRPQTHTQNRNGVTRHGLPQSSHHYLPQPGNTYGSQRFGVGNSTAGTGKLPQFLPFTYPVSDPRQSSFQMGVNSNTNLSSRPSQPYGSGPAYREMCDRMPEGEFAALNPNVAFPMGQSVERMYPDMAPTLSPPQMTKNRGGPMSQLHYYLEECCDQLTCLEKERKKSVILLNKTFPGKRISVATSSPLPKMPPNPSRVDRLIVDQIREQARVVNLLGKMERMSSFPFHGNISSSLDRHYEAICATQNRRREEYINTASRQKQGSPHYRDDKDVMLLAVALKDLCSATRKSRTTLWCALQVTVPKYVGVLDLRGDAETTGTAEESGPERRL